MSRAPRGWRRLRVGVSDSTMCEATTLLRAAATFLVLRMAESGSVVPDLTLDNPVRAIGEVSQDITGRSILRLVGDAAGRGGPPAVEPFARHPASAPQGAVSLAAAHLVIARELRFAGWPRLQAVIDAEATAGRAADEFAAGSVHGRVRKPARSSAPALASRAAASSRPPCSATPRRRNCKAAPRR
jgi:hypothetical protein